MDALTIRYCTIDEIEHAPNIGALIDEYAEESRSSELPQHSAQWAQYRQLEAVGALTAIGAFKGNELIGFVGVLKSFVPHYGAPMAVTESLFVAKAHRKNGTGLRLIKAAEEFAKSQEIACLMVSAPHGGSLEQVMPRLGYRHSNTVFVRSLA